MIFPGSPSVIALCSSPTCHTLSKAFFASKKTMTVDSGCVALTDMVYALCMCVHSFKIDHGTVPFPKSSLYDWYEFSFFQIGVDPV